MLRIHLYTLIVDRISKKAEDAAGGACYVKK